MIVYEWCYEEWDENNDIIDSDQRLKEYSSLILKNFKNLFFMSYFKHIEQIESSVSLTTWEKEIEKILLNKAFSRQDQEEMFRLLAKFINKAESELHYHGDSYLKYLINSGNDFINKFKN